MRKNDTNTSDKDEGEKKEEEEDEEEGEKLQHSVTLGSLHKSFKDYKWKIEELTPE